MRSGYSYNVAVSRSEDRCVITKGWELICKDHDIGNGDSGVFTYHGESEICLRLYDKHGLEKISSFTQPSAAAASCEIGMTCADFLYKCFYNLFSSPTDYHHDPLCKTGSSSLPRKDLFLAPRVNISPQLLTDISSHGHQSLPSYICRLTEANINRGTMVSSILHSFSIISSWNFNLTPHFPPDLSPRTCSTSVLNTCWHFLAFMSTPQAHKDQCSFSPGE